jgi:hypothetical protein
MGVFDMWAVKISEYPMLFFRSITLSVYHNDTGIVTGPRSPFSTQPSTH